MTLREHLEAIRDRAAMYPDNAWARLFRSDAESALKILDDSRALATIKQHRVVLDPPEHMR